MMTAPKSALFSAKIDTLFQKIAHQRSDAWNLDPFRWDWSSGVGLAGLAEAHRVTGREALGTYIQHWLPQVTPQRKFGSVNHVAPAKLALYLLSTPAGAGLADARLVAKEYAAWCLTGAERTRNGGWAHVWEGGDPDYRHQLWVDTVFMAVTFLARHATQTGDETCLQEAMRQLKLHSECLFDESAGLFRHAYHCERRVGLGEHWGRGNGWMVASLAEMIELLRQAGRSDRLAEERFVTAMRTAYGVRGPGGLLRTLPLVPDSYWETTATGLFGYAALRGVSLGLLPAEFRAWGLEIAATVCDRIDATGQIADCSYGTNPEPRATYLALPFCQSLYADGIALMLLARALETEACSA